MEVSNALATPGAAGHRFYHPKLPWPSDFFDKLVRLEWYATSTDIARMRIKRGIAHVDLMEFDPAVDEFDASIQAYSDNPVAYFERGRAYWQTGRFEEAAADLQAAVIGNPTSPHFRFHTYALLGDSLRRVGKYDGAAMNLSIALNYHIDGHVYLSRGRAYLEKKDRTRAVADFGEAIRLDPGIRESVPAVPEP